MKQFHNYRILRYKYLYYFIFLLLLGGLFIPRPQPAFAFQVEPLPGDNLVKNPWFRSAANPDRPGLDGWTDAGGLNKYWSTSQKESNPSPDIVISGVCIDGTVYCGTSARLSTTPGQSGGIGEVGVDAQLYQVIPANPANRMLKFFAHWVSHEINPAEVTIYGGTAPTGPWTPVWKPFHQIVETEEKPPPGEGTSALWISMTATTPPTETILPAGFPYYKLEIHARLTDPITSGFKMTGVYFAAVPEPVTPTPTSGASPSPTSLLRISPTPTLVKSKTPTPTSLKSPTPTAILVKSPTPTATLVKSPTPTPTLVKSPTPNATLVKSPTPLPTPTSARIKEPTATPTISR